MSDQRAMRTLATELGAWIDRTPTGPRVYADANVPAGLIAFMRQQLRWDVFSVMEQAELRRARDTEHFRLARQMHRTLITLDRDYFDDRRFPPGDSGGVIVLSAPDEERLARALRDVDKRLRLHASTSPNQLPLLGQKVHVYPEPPDPRRQRRRRRR